MVTQATFNTQQLIKDEVFSFVPYDDVKADPIQIKVVGVIDAKDSKDLYWSVPPSEYDAQCFLQKEDFIQFALGKEKKNAYGSLNMKKYFYLDFSKMKFETIEDMQKTIADLKKEHMNVNFDLILESCLADKQRIIVTMNILQVPTLFLIGIFVFMITKQMLSMEQNEISMLKSRGASRLQILGIYFLQSVIVGFIGLIFGIGLGFFLAHVLGASNSFMEFVGRKALPITMTKSTIVYALVAFVISVFVMTIPVIPMSMTTIVEHKQKKRKHKSVWWKRMFLDLVLLVVSLYGFYNFNGQKELLEQKVQEGITLDPLLFLSSSLFVLGCGMLVTRLNKYLVCLMFWLRKKKWKTSSYMAFLQIIRNGEAQNFIMIFLVCTVALGIFNANTARTINQNKENEIRYENGADLVLQEAWESNLVNVKYAKQKGLTEVPLSYMEPDYYKYNEIEAYAKSMTKVYSFKQNEARKTSEKFTLNEEQTEAAKTESATQTDSKAILKNVQIMGIQTKEFGNTAWMPDKLLDKHWYYYLNDMAKNPNAILVSKNAQKALGLKIGDCLEYTRINEVEKRDGIGTGVICGFVDYFPGYDSEILQADGVGDGVLTEQYLIVANFDLLTNYFGKVPYEIWIKNQAGSSYLYDFTEKNELSFLKFEDTTNEIVKMKNDPVVQETNGLLTISFLISIVVCFVGFLISQITSMRARELMFGIYRAMGLGLKDILGMLIKEQLLSSFFAIMMGIAVGFLASYLYIPLIEIAYSAGGEIRLPASVICKSVDMLRLLVVISTMLFCCVFIIGKIITTMKISQALKLGEE